MKILLLNGPPRCGKDTISQIIKDDASSIIHQEKFARPMKVTTPLIYGITLQHWVEHLDTPQNKDMPCDEFFGKTPREVQIALSEDYLKPLHGSGIFGQLAVRRIEMINFNWFELVVMSDSGFYDEALMIIERFGADNVELWNILREGCNFKKDSRDYIDLKDQGVQQYYIENNGSLDDLRDLVIPLYEGLLLPIEGNTDDKGVRTIESFESWKARRVEHGHQTFMTWPDRKIARIEREREKNNDTDTTVLPTEQGDKDSDSGGSTVSGGC